MAQDDAPLDVSEAPPGEAPVAVLPAPVELDPALAALSPVLINKMSAILQKVRAYHPDPDLELLRKAFALAAKMHTGQMRKSGEPYLLHPLEVTDIIADLHLDIASLCAGMLHDVVEDTEVSIDEIKVSFGHEIAFIVDGVTKLSKYAFKSKEERNAESFRKFVVAMASDIRVVLVKLADRMHNMRTLKHMVPEKQREKALETMEIYAPLANRLGIQWMKSELEDQSFRYLHPEDYFALAEAIKAKKSERERYIVETVGLIRNLLGDHRIEAEVAGRPKHFFSIWKKMRESSIGLDQVYDQLAFRILVAEVKDCYGVLGLIHSLWRPVPGRFKDYIAMPKPNGYQSLHTSVVGPYQERVEIQIRTLGMHRIAEEGVAAHWQYKEGKAIPDRDAARFEWLRQLIEWQQELADPQEFMDMVKVDMFNDEVFTLTPDGDVKVLPVGATPVDFAYAVHTEVGNRCSGARVNGQLVPLRHQLQNGDTVEIITSAHQRPNPDWLGFAKTSRARAKIKHHVRQEQRDTTARLGRELLERELRRHNLSLRRLLKSGELEAAAVACKLQNAEELIVQLGYGKLQIETVLRKLIPEDATPGALPDALDEDRLERVAREAVGKKPGIALDGVDDVMVRYARCCNPVPGEDVVGFVTRGRGLTVHARTCPKVHSLEADRIVDAYWGETDKAVRSVAVRVMCDDRPGLLANISAGFTSVGVNIAEAHCRATPDGRATNTFEVLVRDAQQLEGAIRAIRRIDGVTHVERLRV